METAIDLINQLNTGVLTMDDLLQPPGRRLYDIPINNLSIDVIPSGFPSCDDLMLLKRGRSELIVVGGRPSIGKSAWAFQLALQASKSIPVHVFSLEMDAESILTRLISSKTGVSINSIQRGYTASGVLEKARETLKEYMYVIDDRPGMTLNMICDAARERKRYDNTGLIVIDYLQLIIPEKSHTREVEIGDMSRALKALAKELKVPIVLLSQLNRQCEIRSKSGRPIMSDLKDSGSIEADADVVVLLNREDVYTGERRGEADVIIAKNRSGKTGTIVMQYLPQKTMFVDQAGV